MPEGLDFKLLGPIEVTREGEPLDLGPYKQRTLLALLLANANQVVSTDRLTDALWGERATDKEKTLWVYISRLRSALEPDRTGRGESSVLLTKEPGYVLTTDPETVDFLRFERALAEARNLVETDPDGAVEILDRALELWRGDALADFVYETFARNEIERLTELRLEASELRFDAQLKLGHAGDLVSGLEALTRDNPYRERSVEQLMVALYRSGRQAEALRAYERHRRTVADELGIEPSPELRRLEEQILLHDDRMVAGDRGSRRPLLVDADHRNPYKGLHAFSESDETTYFGRERLVAELVRRIEGNARLIAVVGPSGSGKSSAVRAGLIPRVRKSLLPGSAEWVVAQMVPGAHPFTELEAALVRARLDGPDRIPKQPDEDDTAILGACLRVLPDDNARLLLVIDQFEELFTLVEDGDEQQRFLAALLVAIDDPHGRIAVVLTLRADFYDRPLLHPGFGPRLGEALVNVAPLTSQELEEAASQPAAIAGVRLEPPLLARLVADVADQPGALPMFQYTLTELHERRSGDVLLESAYDDMGGLRGAITNRAEELYAALMPDEQAAARQLFLRLVAISDEQTYSRRRVHAAEVISMDSDVVALKSAIDEFGKHRLLLFDRDKVTGSPTVEVGHEALLTEWPRLQEWISAARHDLMRHSSLVAAVDEWERADRDPGYLVTGARLAEYEAGAVSSTLELNKRELEFLEISTRARTEQVRLDQERNDREARLAVRAKRRLWALVAVLSVVAGLVGAFFAVTSAEDTQIAFVHQGNSVAGDLVLAGLDEAERRFDITVVERTPPWTTVADVHDTLAEGGTDLIFIDAALDDGEAVFGAKMHPETRFGVFSGVYDTTAANYVGYRFADEEAAYLAGVAAAMESSSRTLGFVGAARISDVDARRAGFEAGARSIDPLIRVEVRYLVDGNAGELIQAGALADAFGRPDLGYAAARELFDGGADVVFHSAGSSGLGVFRAARETTERIGRQAWGIGADSDQFFDSPAEDAEYVLMSTIRRFDTIVIDEVERLLEDRFEGGERVFSLANEGLGYATTGNKLAPATIAAIEQAQQSIIAGNIDVPTVPRSGGRDDEALEVDATDARYELVGGGNVLTAVGPPTRTNWSATRFEENGELTGFQVELLDEIADRLGLVVRHVDAPFEEMVPGVAAGKYDLAIFQADITPQRLEVVAFTAPHLRGGAALLAPEDSAISSIDDVSTLAVGNGSSHEELVRTMYPDIDLVPVSNNASYTGLIARGEVDAVVRDFAEDWPDGVVAVQVLFELDNAFPVNPALTALVADMDLALADMIADGTYDQLYEKWFLSCRFIDCRFDTPDRRVDIDS